MYMYTVKVDYRVKAVKLSMDDALYISVYIITYVYISKYPRCANLYNT